MNLIKLDCCPICKSDNNSYLGKSKYKNKILKYRICQQCTLIYMNPRPSQIWYNKLYAKDFWDEKKKDIGDSKVHIKSQLFKQILWATKIRKYLISAGFNKKKNPKILEIGCSYGKIVNDLACKFNGEGWGVEPSDEAFEFAKNKIGLKIYARNMDEVLNKSEEKIFDLIFFSHCLENITNPISTLNKVSLLLKDDGLLFIDTPNNFFRLSWHIYHPYCYTYNSICELLDQTNFQIKKSFNSGRPKIIFGNLYLSIIASKKKNSINKNRKKRFPFIKMKIGKIMHLFLVKSFIGKINRIIAKIYWVIPKKEINSLDKYF